MKCVNSANPDGNRPGKMGGMMSFGTTTKTGKTGKDAEKKTDEKTGK